MRKSRLRSVAPRLASCPRCGTPTTSAPGWRFWERIIGAIVRAASQASKVADYLRAFLPEVTVDMTTERAEQEAA